MVHTEQWQSRLVTVLGSADKEEADELAMALVFLIRGAQNVNADGGEKEARWRKQLITRWGVSSAWVDEWIEAFKLLDQKANGQLLIDWLYGAAEQIVAAPSNHPANADASQCA